MLDELVVENLGLIASAHLEPGPGLIAVTGETGAGKTLLLGALRLLRGDTARTDVVGPAGPTARVEGRFLLGDEGEVTAGRRVDEGRSRAYLDGSPVPARILEERLGSLVEIVGQHDHVAIGREAAARTVVDGRLDEPGRAARSAYAGAWRRFEALEVDRDALGGDRRALERELDVVRHQAREIAAARLRPDEDADLRGRIELLRHAEDVAAGLEAAVGGLTGEEGAADRLGGAVAALRRAAAFDASLVPVLGDLEALAGAATEAAVELRRRHEGIEADPAELERLNQRLAVLSDLRRKYGTTLSDVAAFGEQAARRAEEIEGLLGRAAGIEAELEAAGRAVAEEGGRLTEARRRAAAAVSAAAAGHLRDLGFPDPVVDVTVRPSPPGPRGADRIEIVFSSDAGLEPGPVARVASGGELSRLVLAVRLAGGVAEAPVVAFDEVDAGIGGRTALAMGEKLARLAAGRQVFVVTHLPQVAAFADGHFVVDRDRDRATVRMVAGEERTAEIARMLGGLPESERGREHADELLALAAGRRGR